MAESNANALQGILTLVLAGAAWLYFSGRLDPLIEGWRQSGLPADEAAFVRIIEDAKHRWQDAPNDIQREPVPAARNAALCSVPLTVSGWTGRVERVGTYLASEGLLLGRRRARDYTAHRG